MGDAPGNDDEGRVLLDDDERQRELAEAAERQAQARTITQEAGFSQRFIAAVTGPGVTVTVLAVVAALVVGALIIAASDEATRQSLQYFFARPSDTLVAAWDAISSSYAALLRGALVGTRSISETLVATTPLILTGLAVAVPLRTGLFNIGAQGQLIAGGTVAGLVGFALTGLPTVLHLPLAVLAGMAAGAAIGWIPGVLKARTGAHEVITTIMLNNIAVGVLSYLLITPLFLQPGRADPISKSVAGSARLPALLPAPQRVHAGLLVALALAAVIFWLIERSTRGFELQAVGSNARAATNAGMDPGRAIVFAMTVGGALAGAGGAAEILGLQHRLAGGFAGSLGFDGITVALLGRGGIGGTVAAGLLFGGLKAGGRNMQAVTQTSLDLVLVIQALIIVFIAAPGLVRAIFRIRTTDTGTGQISKGWGA